MRRITVRRLSVNRPCWHPHAGCPLIGESPVSRRSPHPEIGRDHRQGAACTRSARHKGRVHLVAIGPVSIEYQAAMIRDELEESAGWTTVGIARVLTEKQARTIAAAT